MVKPSDDVCKPYVGVIAVIRAGIATACVVCYRAYNLQLVLNITAEYRNG